MSLLRKAAILAAGWILIAVGTVLIPLPGPGIPVLAGGIVVLSLKSPRARWLLRRFKSSLLATYPDAWKTIEKLKAALCRRPAPPRTAQVSLFIGNKYG